VNDWKKTADYLPAINNLNDWRKNVDYLPATEDRKDIDSEEDEHDNMRDQPAYNKHQIDRLNSEASEDPHVKDVKEDKNKSSQKEEDEKVEEGSKEDEPRQDLEGDKLGSEADRKEQYRDDHQIIFLDSFNEEISSSDKAHDNINLYKANY